MAGGVPDNQREMVIPRHRPRAGGVEGSDGDSKSPFHSLHHLPRLPPWIPGRPRYRYRHPRGQNASAVSDYERGGPVSDLDGPAKCV